MSTRNAMLTIEEQLAQVRAIMIAMQCVALAGDHYQAQCRGRVRVCMRWRTMRSPVFCWRSVTSY